MAPRFSVWILCGVCVLITGSVIQAQKMDMKIEPYVFQNDKKENVDAEFGRLTVQESRDSSSDRKIELAFVRFKSTSKSPGAPIVYLAGGPGGSGISSAKFGRFPLFMKMREFGDVIALDQRGTGLSKPSLRCLTRLDLPLDKPLTREALAERVAERLRGCADYWKKQGVDTRSYNTEESAADLEDLRRALGVPKIRLWGISYGSHLGLAAIRKFPDSIESAVLAGIESTPDTLKLPSNTELLIDDLNRRLKADPDTSKKVSDLRELMAEVLDGLEKKPATITVKNRESGEEVELVVGKFDVQLLTSAASGNNGFQAVLPKAYYEMKQGDFSLIGEFLLGTRSRGTPSLMSVAMDCGSGVSKARLKQIRQEASSALLGDAINSPYPEICSAIAFTDLGSEFRKPVKSRIPVLFISGTLDGRTPVSNGELALKGFPNGKHLIINGAGHSDPLFLSSPKIAETMSDFFSGKKVEKERTIEMDKPFKFQAF